MRRCNLDSTLVPASGKKTTIVRGKRHGLVGQATCVMGEARKAILCLDQFATHDLAFGLLQFEVKS